MTRNERVEDAVRNFVDTEAAIIRWVAGSKPEDEAWWHALPSYEQQAWRNRHDVERHTGRPMRSAGYIYNLEADAFEQTKKLANSWAAEIRLAWKNRQPCPIVPTPQFQHVLDYAFELAALRPEHFPEPHTTDTKDTTLL